MKAENWSDFQIIESIKNPGLARRNRAIYHVFFELDWKGLAIAHVLKHSGMEVDGEDVAQDAITAFDKNIREDKFKGSSTLKTYFMSIVKNQWLNRLRDRKPLAELKQEDYEAGEGDVEEIYVNDEFKKYTNILLEQFGDRCKKMLILNHTGYTHEEIAKQVGLSSASMAKKEIYRCRERMRKFIDQNPGWMDFLT